MGPSSGIWSKSTGVPDSPASTLTIVPRVWLDRRKDRIHQRQVGASFSHGRLYIPSTVGAEAAVWEDASGEGDIILMEERFLMPITPPLTRFVNESFSA